MNNSYISIKKLGSVAVIGLERLPNRLFSKEPAEEFAATILTVETEPKFKYLVFRGTADCFCLGLDVDNYNSGKITVSEFSAWEKILYSIENLSKVTVAVIEGECWGAGIQLALACDVRIGSNNSIFMHDEIKRRVLPGNSVFQIGKFCGLGKMMELLQTGIPYSAQEAKQWGIIQYCCDSASLDDELRAIINNYEQNDMQLHQLVRRLSKEAYEMRYEDFLGCCLAAQHRVLSL